MSEDESIRLAPRPSSMHTILPTAFQFSPLASVRRSISDYSPRSRRRVSNLVVQRPSISELTSGQMELAGLSESGTSDTERKYALQGSHLLKTALSESQLQDPQSKALARQLYINSISYLLQGLPSDLTDQEALHLRVALPTELQNAHHPESDMNERRNPSILHRGVATMIISCCLLLRLALPYIKYLLAVAYSYERTNHVTEKMLAMSMDTVDTLGRKSMAIAGTAMDNKLIMGTVTYCVEGICGGLNEGLGEGIKVIEGRNGS